MNRVQLRARLSEALAAVAEDHRGFEFSKASDPDGLPEILLFLTIGTDVSLKALEPVELADGFEEGEELGLGVFPKSATEAQIDASGARPRIEAMRAAVRETMAAPCLNVIEDEHADASTRDLAETVASAFGIDRRERDLWSGPAYADIRGWLASTSDAADERAVGELVVSDGRLVACDPGLVGPEDEALFMQPLDHRVAPGRYPVRALFRDGQLRAVAVGLRPGPVVKLARVLREGQSPGALRSDAGTGYPVDCGWGAVMDMATRQRLVQRCTEEEHADWLIGPMHRAGVGTDKIAFVALSDDGGHQMLGFNTGGDGFAELCWGLDESGEIASLLTIVPG